MSKGNHAERAYDLAHSYLIQYGSCPQAVLRAVHEALNLKGIEAVIKSAHALAGGLGLSGNGACGALSGGVLALSFFFGRSLEDMDKGPFMKSFIKAKELHDKFVNEFGGCTCKDVQVRLFGKTFDFWSLDDLMKFREIGGLNKCAIITGKVAMWVTEMLLSDEESRKRLGI